MRILLIPIGSHGDVHPFAAMALELKRRGHDVTVATNEFFRPIIERLGVSFLQQGTAAEYQETLRNPAIWHPTEGPRWMFGLLVDKPLREVYQTITDFAGGERITIVAPSTAFAARIAQEKQGHSLVTIHLAPSSLRSVAEVPVLPGLPLPTWSPKWLRRAVFWALDAFVADRICAGRINQFRKELGLPPVRRILNEWWNSPQRIIGLFPDWFANAPDWPPQTRLADFPLYDERDHHDLPADVEAFLQSGAAPLVFTPGSANAQAEKFFLAAIEACQLLERRALFLTVHPEHLPAALPASIKHLRYVPFSQVLPRSAAIIHHGGIGTTAQSLAAGIPQLVMPLGFDQFDNAARCERLGVAGSVLPARFTGANVAQKLRELLTPSVQQCCQQIASRFKSGSGVARACDWIEDVAERPATEAVPAAHRS